MPILSYVRMYKLPIILCLIIAYLLFRPHLSYRSSYNTSFMGKADMYDTGMVSESSMPMTGGGVANKMGIMPPIQDYAPAPQVKDRMIITDSSISLLVTNVRESMDNILSYTKQIGGYMVSSSLNNPGESPTAYLTIRVPSARLQETLQRLRSTGIKVIGEDLTGQDVTDQYVDNDARLATLMATKQKFQAIFERAAEISDIVNIQREMISLESQIDSIKGQQQYLSQSAQTAKITITLSTDELALQYNPADAWRPQVIFKQAVRSLILHLRMAAAFLIYIGVYAIFWVPAVIIGIVVWKRIYRQ